MKHVILGGTGRVGSAVVRALLGQGEAVTVVTRSAGRAADLAAAGARVAEVDIRDAAALRGVFRDSRRAFLLNPPADPSGDTETEERAGVAAILAALEGSGLEKVVAASTYGARPGTGCADLTVLHELEEGLRRQPIPAAINRGAYYMSNWTGMVDVVRGTGTLPSFFPPDLALPTVAPEDLGAAAAQRLLTPPSDAGLAHVEGPARYSPRDVADAFARALGTPVAVETIPPEAWPRTFAQLGFSDAATASYTCMLQAVVRGETETPDDPRRGTTTLDDYVRAAVAQT